MPGRAQALMRTRCPACSTVFRVTSEQLRLKAGKVRCGHCQTIFNAFDEFLPEDQPADSRTEPTVSVVKGLEQAPAAWPEIVIPERLAEEESAGPVAQSLPDEPGYLPLESIALAEPSVAKDEVLAQMPAADATAEGPLQALAEATVAEDFSSDKSLTVREWPAEDQQAEAIDMIRGPVTEPLPETQEESTQAARQAGLVAARELAESPAYNRWAAGTLADGSASSFTQTPARRLVWPFVVVALLLALGLLLQLLLYFRSDVVRWLPAAGDYYQQAGISVPLPRNPDLVVIEASDLQADNARGLFVLQATLHNRAAYAQDWPALELTLTDASDSVVARRVMSAADYLPPAISPEVFPANGEVAVRLWIEARELGAAGYRLYVFYP